MGRRFQERHERATVLRVVFIRPVECQPRLTANFLALGCPKLETDQPANV